MKAEVSFLSLSLPFSASGNDRSKSHQYISKCIIHVEVSMVLGSESLSSKRTLSRKPKTSFVKKTVMLNLIFFIYSTRYRESNLEYSFLVSSMTKELKVKDLDASL